MRWSSESAETASRNRSKRSSRLRARLGDGVSLTTSRISNAFERLRPSISLRTTFFAMPASQANQASSSSPVNRPIASNATPEGRQMNRRTEFHALKEN